MRVAIHTKNDKPGLDEGRNALETALTSRGIEIVDNWHPEVPVDSQFAIHDTQSAPDMVISIGGDGTLLSAVHRIGAAGIPVVGINFGHLGFLTTAGRADIEMLADSLIAHRYSIEKRSMLQICTPADTLFALNEVYLHRGELAPLLHTQVQIDSFDVATYSADGLIVATPTGSTAYSLSCGGPILVPGSRSLVITPIAAHTLTLRPLVVSDSSTIRLSHNDDRMVCTLGADSYVTTLSGRWSVEIKRADYEVSLVRLEQQNFYTAIRNKLMWGR